MKINTTVLSFIYLFLLFILFYEAHIMGIYHKSRQNSITFCNNKYINNIYIVIGLDDNIPYHNAHILTKSISLFYVM